MAKKYRVLNDNGIVKLIGKFKLKRYTHKDFVQYELGQSSSLTQVRTFAHSSFLWYSSPVIKDSCVCDLLSLDEYRSTVFRDIKVKYGSFREVKFIYIERSGFNNEIYFSNEDMRDYILNLQDHEVANRREI